MKKIRLSQKAQNLIFGILCLWSLFMFLACMSLFVSCNAQENSKKSAHLPEWSNTDHTNGPIIFEFENMDSCAYSFDDGCFLIWYDDQDAWDYDNLAYRTGREEWYGDYILLDIEDSLVEQFLQDFHKYVELSCNYRQNWEEIDMLSSKWAIYENYVAECKDYVFELVRMEDTDWWFK